MLMATTQNITGYTIIRHGYLAWGSGSSRNLCDAVTTAVNQLEINAENNGYNAVVGITHSAVWDTEDEKYVVSAMGTVVDVEE